MNLKNYIKKKKNLHVIIFQKCLQATLLPNLETQHFICANKTSLGFMDVPVQGIQKNEEKLFYYIQKLFKLGIV